MKAIKLLGILLIVGILVFALTACGETNETEVQPQEEIEEEVQEEVTPVEEEEQDIIEGMPNPVVEYDNLEDAVIYVGHLDPLPTIYERYTKKVAVINNDLIQIEYWDDAGRVLTLREQGGVSDDISGNYNSYPYSKTIQINDVNVEIKGESGDSINVVTWNNGVYAHSLDYEDGHSLEEITDVVKEING